MEKPETQFTNESQSVHLIPRERSAMLHAILGEARQHADTSESRTSPFALWNASLWMRLAPVGVALLFVIAMVPLTNTAQESAPGDFLYDFEINVIEEIEAQMQFTAAAKSRFYTERLTERLHEMQHIEKPIALAHSAAIAQEIAAYAASAVAAGDGIAEETAHIDQLVTLTALVEAHEDFFEEIGTAEADRVADTASLITEELTAEIDAYVDGAALQVVLSEISDDLAVIAAEQEAGTVVELEPLIDAALVDVAEHIATDDYGGALLITSDIRSEIRKHALLETQVPK